MLLLLTVSSALHPYLLKQYYSRFATPSPDAISRKLRKYHLRKLQQNTSVSYFISQHFILKIFCLLVNKVASLTETNAIEILSSDHDEGHPSEERQNPLFSLFWKDDNFMDLLKQMSSLNNWQLYERKGKMLAT